MPTVLPQPEVANTSLPAAWLNQVRNFLLDNLQLPNVARDMMPVPGQLRYDAATGLAEYYDAVAGEWAPFSSPQVTDLPASGGDIVENIGMVRNTFVTVRTVTIVARQRQVMVAAEMLPTSLSNNPSTGVFEFRIQHGNTQIALFEERGPLIASARGRKSVYGTFTATPNTSYMITFDVRRISGGSAEFAGRGGFLILH